MERSKITAQARAKLIWGEPPQAVHEFLVSHGISDGDADAKIAEFSAERAADIRRIGVNKIFIGGLLTGASVVFFYFGYRDGAFHTDYRSARGQALIAVAGIYGSWKLIDGIIYLVGPRSEKRSITEIAE